MDFDSRAESWISEYPWGDDAPCPQSWRCHHTVKEPQIASIGFSIFLSLWGTAEWEKL
jgi:hypothetical protein